MDETGQKHIFRRLDRSKIDSQRYDTLIDKFTYKSDNSGG